MRFLRLLLVTVIAVAVLGCAPTPDGGAEIVKAFFTNLENHHFDAAADLIREADGVPLSAATRDSFMRGWRRAYEGYDIHFTRVVVQRYGDTPFFEIPAERIRRAGAVEGHAYAVKFEGTSNSPCVPVNSEVIPGTTQPIALKRADATWFLLAESMVGFVDTCPGG